MKTAEEVGLSPFYNCHAYKKGSGGFFMKDHS